MLPAQSNTEPGEDLRVTLTTDGQGLLLRWWGKAGRTYFVQTSPTLSPGSSWHYEGSILMGSDALVSLSLPAQPSPSFIRLRYSDLPVTGDPLDADHDQDGITNRDEVRLHGTNPLDPDSDDDGMPDGWEHRHGLNFNDARDADLVLDPALTQAQRAELMDIKEAGVVKSYPEAYAASWGLSQLQWEWMKRIDPDHDGWTNLEEFLSGTNPRVADTTYLRVRRGGLQTAIAGQVLPEPIVVQAIREVVGAGGLRTGFTALADEEVSFSGPADIRFIQEGDELSPGANPLTLRTDEAGYANVRAQAPSQVGRHTIYVRLGNGREAALSLEVQPPETGGIPGGGGPGDGPGSPPPNPEFTLQWQHVWRSASMQGSNSTGGFSSHRTQQKAAAPGVQPQRAGAEAGYPSMSSPAGHYGHNDSNHAQRDPQRVETWRILYDPAWREYGSSDFGNVYVQDWHKSAPPVNAESILAIPFESFSPELWTHARGEHVLGLSRSNVGPWIEGEENGETIRGREITASTTQHRARLVAMKDGQPVDLPQGTTLALLVMETVTQFDDEGGAGMATETRVRKTLQMVIPPGGSTSPPIETEDLMSPAAPNTEKLLRLLPVEVAVDADRNGQVEFGKDTTTADKPYEFWVNHDRDIGHTVDGDDWEEDDVQGNETAETWDIFEPGLKWRRDLEDLTRVWIDLSGFGSALNTHDANIKLYARMEPSDGDPQVTLYQAVETDGGRKYLTDSDTGYSQTQIYFGEELCTAVNTPQGSEVPRRAWEDLSADKAIHLLFEGRFAGKGKLIFEFRKGGQVFATMPPVFLHLKNVEDMYETWTVGDVTDQGEHYNIWPAASTTKTTGQNLPTPKTSQEKDYFLFVHGWNMSPFDKDVFAATAFKRLWHQGYKGRFGAFRWPTFWFAAPVPNTDNFDGSEQRAWNSGAPLAGLVSQLSSTFQEGGQSKVRLYAHSMGNIVASECLRQSAQASKVHTYIAAQAALSSHVWDNTTPLMPFTVGGNPFGGGPETPDVYGYYWEAGATTQPHEWQGEGRPSYMDPRYMPSSVRYINHYNPYDWALSFGRWQVNQMLKPDVGYHYSIINPFNLTDLNKRFWKSQATRLDFPDDRLEIFSFAAESHSYATGQQGSTGGMFGAAVDLNAAPFSFGAAHKGHSKQFRSSIQDLWLYWKRVIDDMRITVP